MAAEVRPFDTGRARTVARCGSRGQMAQAVQLALHELVTTAAKHGTLATPQGRLEVTWKMERRTGSDGACSGSTRW